MWGPLPSEVNYSLCRTLPSEVTYCLCRDPFPVKLLTPFVGTPSQLSYLLPVWGPFPVKLLTPGVGTPSQ
ncbi:hypothetical protein DPMN_149795 [Dreissena polymorpha]|uniref:Uncharacterized protein n=1 Tax=Dreissena polymorpha TaxID=45954 RepID=A0A9D4FDC4_DREPO|nr:hypothetical protein DPMN_149795 [Dreissena polymorpha]